jgi:hypothetical protein
VAGRRPDGDYAGDLLLARTADGFHSNQGIRRSLMVVLMLAINYWSMAGGEVRRRRRYAHGKEALRGMIDQVEYTGRFSDSP